MYRIREQTENLAVYEYLCEDYQRPYTGIIEINKKTLETKVIKAADGELSEERARVYAMAVLPKNNYPETYTHTAI